MQPEKYINVQYGDYIYAYQYHGDVKTHKVEFVDYNGHMLCYPQSIAEGQGPVLPPKPKREGYTFTGWNKRSYPITAPMKIQANYILGTYDTYWVVFYGKITGHSSMIPLKEEYVPVGRDATPPIPPVNAGYVFTGWDSGYTNIQSTTSLFANYALETSVTGGNKLKIYKFLISLLGLSEELEKALIELGTDLARSSDGGAATRIAVPVGLITWIAAAIASFGAYLARPMFDAIAECITTCFGSVADTVVDAIEVALEDALAEGNPEEGDGEADAIALGLSGIAGQYGMFKCKEAADAMADYLKKQKQEFKFITMYYPSKGVIISLTREAIYGFDSKESRISENGYHYGIEYKGMVYCNVHPFGLVRSAWEADFWGDLQAERTITPP